MFHNEGRAYECNDYCRAATVVFGTSDIGGYAREHGNQDRCCSLIIQNISHRCSGAFAGHVLTILSTGKVAKHLALFGRILDKN